MQSEIEVEISDTQNHLRLEPGAVDRLVRLVLAAQDRPRASISIALVDNATIHTINQAHLGHDWPTDVITFPLADPDEAVLAGELVVSAEMACVTAQELGIEPGGELALYVVHGLLHLCGFDDHDDVARQRMRQREGELLSQAGLGAHPLLPPLHKGGKTDRPGLGAHTLHQTGKAASLREHAALPPGYRAPERRPVAHDPEGRPWTD